MRARRIALRGEVLRIIALIRFLGLAQPAHLRDPWRRGPAPEKALVVSRTRRYWWLSKGGASLTIVGVTLKFQGTPIVGKSPIASPYGFATLYGSPAEMFSASSRTPPPLDRTPDTPRSSVRNVDTSRLHRFVGNRREPALKESIGFRDCRLRLARELALERRRGFALGLRKTSDDATLHNAIPFAVSWA
jgi:hypothetical protein